MLLAGGACGSDSHACRIVLPYKLTSSLLLLISCVCVCSLQLNPSSVHLTAVLVEYETRTGRTNQGVATSWLKRLQQGIAAAPDAPAPRIPIFIRHSSLRLPYRSSCPVVMVGPGTGLAPFRGFIQDRKWVKDSSKWGGASECIKMGHLFREVTVFPGE